MLIPSNLTSLVCTLQTPCLIVNYFSIPFILSFTQWFFLVCPHHHGCRVKLLLVYLILAFLTDKFYLYATGKFSKVNTFITGSEFHLDDTELFHKFDELCFKVVKFKLIKFTSRTRIRRESSVWMKHRILNLETSYLDFPQDLTICVNVESNPGDTELAHDSSSSSTHTSTTLSRTVNGRLELKSLRIFASSYIAPTVFNRLQSLYILRKCGSRGGCRRLGLSFQSTRSLGNLVVNKNQLLIQAVAQLILLIWFNLTPLLETIPMHINTVKFVYGTLNQ